jgi:uncharacterized membrane protein YbhN (UPF0104 family)
MKIKIKKKRLDYFKENWGAPFIIAFMILLIIAAIYLSLGNEAYANEIAIYAYYALVIGVFLQLASYIKYAKKEEKQTLN